VTANQDKDIPLAEAAKQLDISQELLRKRVYRGLITGYRVSGRWYVILNTDAQDTEHNQEEPARNQDKEDSRLYDTMALDIAFLRAELAAGSSHRRTHRDHQYPKLTASEKVIVVVAPGYFELDSIVQLTKTINEVQSFFNPQLHLLGLLFNMRT
jgi:hypothetical protein